MERTFKVLNYNQPDSDGDIFIPGAMKQKKGEIFLTKDFNSLPIGEIKQIKEKEDGLFVTANMPNESIGLYPAIGFKIIKSHIRDDDTRVIEEFELYQVSLSGQPNVDNTIPPIY